MSDEFVKWERYWVSLQQQPSDINEHLATLCQFGGTCNHITEFGVRHGVSTAAWLAARPQRLVTYDIAYGAPPCSSYSRLLGVDYQHHVADVLEVEIEETDLLFIDTLHTFAQLRQELERHGEKARRYLIFHDVVTFGQTDEVQTEAPQRGLLPAIREYLLLHSGWNIVENLKNNHGLMVLERCT